MKKLFLVFFSFVMIFLSCSKESEKVSNDLSHQQTFSTQRISNISVIDQRLDDFSKIIAIAQKNNEFRSVLLTEAKLNVGTENAILYFAIKDNNISNQGINLSIHDFLKNISDSLGFNYSSNYFDCELIEDMPQLTLSLYITNDNLEISEMESWPKTIVLPETYYFDEVADFSHNAYDENLQTYSISNNIEPEDQNVLNGGPIPYFIIITNYDAFIVTDDAFDLDDGSSIWERMGVDSVTQELIDSLNYAKTNNDRRIIMDVNTCSTTDVNLISYYGLRAMINRITEEGYDPIPPPPPPPGGCPRDAYDDKEEIHQIRLHTDVLREFSKWPRKHTEFKFTMVLPTDPNVFTISTLEVRPTVKRKLVKKYKIYDFVYQQSPLYFLKWHYLEGEHGNPYKMGAVGVNKRTGQEVDFTIGFGQTKFKIGGIELSMPFNLSYTIKNKQKDKVLGESAIYYCDPIANNGQLYSTGSIEIWIQEHQ